MTVNFINTMKEPAKCSHCHNIKPFQHMTPSGRYKIGHASHCLECDKKYFNNSYAKRMKQGIRYKASLVVANMKRRGEWCPEPCEICGTTDGIEGHHDDYDKPRDVRWLCNFHHLEHHKLINVKAIVHSRKNVIEYPFLVV